MRRALATACVLAAMLVTPVPAGAQDEEETPAEQTEETAPARALEVTMTAQGLSITARQVPLETVLREVSRVAGVAVYLEAGLDPKTTRTPTTIAIKNLPIEDALRRLLRDRNFIFGYRADRLDQVRIFGTGAGPFNRLAAGGGEGRDGRRRGSPTRVARSQEADPDAAALETAALTHPDPAERARALSELSGTGDDDRAREAALSVLERDQDPDVLREALSVLESADTVPIDRVMRFASTTAQPELRLQALELISEHGGDSTAVRRFVQGLTRDSNAEVRERAQEILEDLDDGSE